MSDESPAPAAEAGRSPQAEQSGVGWGGWGLSVFSEISRSAVEGAKSAIADIQQPPEQVEQAEEPEGEDELRKAALDKLENASEDSLLGQGLKVFDTSVESFTTGTWQALGSAWKSGSLIVQKLETSASNLAKTIQQGELPAKASEIAPTILQHFPTFLQEAVSRT